MALSRCMRRAIAKKRQAAKAERFDRRIEAARNEHNREIVRANQAAPKERDFMPAASTLGRLSAASETAEVEAVGKSAANWVSDATS